MQAWGRTPASPPGSPAAPIFGAALTSISISCSAAPGDRTDLAAVRVDIDPTQTNPLLFELGAGRRVFGRVDFEGQAEEYALVEVTDARGLVWATALTDGRGEFELRIQPAE